MAADNPTPPEGAREGSFSEQTEDRDVETIELDPGDEITGTIVDLSNGEFDDGGYWVRLRLNTEERGVVDYFGKDEVKRAFGADDLRVGREVWIAKMHEEVTIEDDDIPADSYNPTKIRFIGGD